MIPLRKSMSSVRNTRFVMTVRMKHHVVSGASFIALEVLRTREGSAGGRENTGHNNMDNL